MILVIFVYQPLTHSTRFMINFSQLVNAQQTPEGTFPLLVENNQPLNQGALTAILGENKSVIESKLKQAGAILFRGFPVKDADAFDAFVRALGYESFTYKESLSNAVRINYTERVFTANEAPPNVEIYLHHEMAQTPVSPSRILFFCQSSAQQGGATPICRSDLLYRELEQKAPKFTARLRDLGVKYTSSMPEEDNAGHGQGRGWRGTLSVDSLEEAEAKLKELGYSWSWIDGVGLRVTTPALPAVLDLGDGQASFYNQLIAAYLGWDGVKENPSSCLNFGDGSPMQKEDLQLASKLAQNHTYELDWKDADVVVVDNHRVMHGRKPYSGDRKRVVLVALGK